jgi:hypothetical protein
MGVAGVDLEVAAGALVGLGAGGWLVVRGLMGWRAIEAVEDIATSSISSLAAGEVRLAGTIAPLALTLRSPLQSITCLYYRSRVRQAQGRDERRTVFAAERAVGFTLTDGSGTIRVMPRGATWRVPPVWQDSSGLLDGADPVGLNVSGGSAMDLALTPAQQAQALLTVQPPSPPPDDVLTSGGGGLLGGLGTGLMGGRRDYEEARLVPGDTVTIVGSAVPYRDVEDPATADRDDPTVALLDPEIAADLAAAQASGHLETDPAKAWGNAAIPGFGIGQPTRAPVLDPAARPEPVLAGAAAAGATAQARFDIPADVLVLAVAPGARLTVYAGTPEAATTSPTGGLLQATLGLVVLAGAAALLALSMGLRP